MKFCVLPMNLIHGMLTSIFLLHSTAPAHLDAKRKRALQLKYVPSYLVNNMLLRENFNSVLLRCLELDDANKVLAEFHFGPLGGHYRGDTTTHKVLRDGYYWPTLFKDAHVVSHKCEICQKVVGRMKNDSFPLHPVSMESPFHQWGLDIIGQINHASSLQHKYIITTTYYFNQWVEVMQLWVINSNQVILFLKNNIITHFGVPKYLIFYNASYFSSIELTSYPLYKGIKIRHSTNYYPQGIGLAKSTNKNLIKLLKRTTT